MHAVNKFPDGLAIVNDLGAGLKIVLLQNSKHGFEVVNLLKSSHHLQLASDGGHVDSNVSIELLWLHEAKYTEESLSEQFEVAAYDDDVVLHYTGEQQGVTTTTPASVAGRWDHHHHHHPFTTTTR